MNEFHTNYFYISQRRPHVNNAVGERVFINKRRKIIEMYFIMYFIKRKFINTDIWAT